MASKRKYGTYMSLYRQLKKDGFDKLSGPLVNVLLDTFIERKGQLLAEHCVQAGVLAKFSDLRKKLEHHEWVVYDKEYAIKSRKLSAIMPGRRLYEFLNKEKAKLRETASMDDIRDLDDKKADRSDVEELSKRVEKLEEGYRGIIELLDPPGDNAKVARYAKDPNAILKLVAGEKPNGG